jgi:hypothetical protein
MFKAMLFATALLGMASAAHAAQEIVAMSETTDSGGFGSAGENEKQAVASHPGVDHDTTRAVRIGDVDVVIPLLKGYRDLGGLPDVYRSMFERVAPSSLELLDLHIHEDHDAAGIHDASPRVQYSIYTLRPLKSQRLGQREWGQYRAEVSATLKSMDVAQLLKSHEARANEAMAEHGAEGWEMSELQAGQPNLYRSDEQSLRVIATTSSQQTIEGKTYRFEEVRATANLLVNGKVLIVAAYREFHVGDTRPLEIMAALDAIADRILALNP